MTIHPADALKYAAAILKSRTDWIGGAIAGSTCEGADGHELELDALHDTVREVLHLAEQCGGNPRRYSDGRLVQSSAEIQPGLITQHVWRPDASTEEPTSWRSHLPSDPDVPSPGVYEVELDPTNQHILVRVVRTA